MKFGYNLLILYFLIINIFNVNGYSVKLKNRTNDEKGAELLCANNRSKPVTLKYIAKAKTWPSCGGGEKQSEGTLKLGEEKTVIDFSGFPCSGVCWDYIKLTLMDESGKILVPETNLHVGFGKCQHRYFNILSYAPGNENVDGQFGCHGFNSGSGLAYTS